MPNSSFNSLIHPCLVVSPDTTLPVVRAHIPGSSWHFSDLCWIKICFLEFITQTSVARWYSSLSHFSYLPFFLPVKLPSLSYISQYSIVALPYIIKIYFFVINIFQHHKGLFKMNSPLVLYFFYKFNNTFSKSWYSCKRIYIESPVFKFFTSRLEWFFYNYSYPFYSSSSLFY